ncbi:MAG: bifunctional diguanylate cyclase/phosphodiesterase [Sulfuricella sp.]|nr:bifunctional diguanylate cyclase/phosphodiesterase [Sulfuricella sp.]
MLKTLKGFILTASVLVSLVFFGGTYFVFSNIYSDSIKENALYVSTDLAQLTFNSMFQIMSKGWKRAQLEEFISATKKSVQDTPTEIDIYRGETVSQLFGPIMQGEMDTEVKQAFGTGAELHQAQESRIRYIFPLKAEEKCLRCHVNARIGNVLGVIDVKQDLAPLIDKAKSKFFLSLVVIAPIPFLIAFLVVVSINRKIERSITRLGQRIESVSKVSDLKNLELGEVDLGFAELNNIVQKIEQLSDKLKSVAVDKDLLEFEIRLLEKFVITSDVVKDWREYVGLLLIEINKVINAYTLFSIFKVDEEVFDLEIFWRHAPSKQTKKMLEHTVRKLLSSHPQFSGDSAVTIVHNVADASHNLADLSERDIEVQMKSLLVETPKIGGIVGIGVQADMIRDATRMLVMESILSTLLNVVGSIKAIHKYTRDLEYYATRDPLTNLYNQRLFWELFEYEIGRAGRHGYKFSLLVLDLDNFKSVNDTYGHSFGDKFLQEVAVALREVLRTEDILARYGGDEFVAILPETGAQEAAMAAKRALDAISAMAVVSPDGTVVKGSVSVGIGVYPDHATMQKDLFLFADNMMYKAKTEGKNRIGVPTEEDIVEVFRNISETSIIILNAVENRKIIPFFQPLVDSRGKQTKAVEVLSRIDLGNDKIMGAGDFVEIAEKIGVIHKMDYIVMEKALQAVQEQGFQGNIFLNLSPRALVLNEFISEARRIVAGSGIDPGRIVFEITERETIKNMNMLEKFVNNLKLEGFKLAIDDFGSGFSSFHYLKRFPIDFLKIEGDFIVNMTSSEKDMAFVRSIAMLAQELGIQTVAEYVENEDVLQSVSDIGIDLAQGYYIGRPSENLPKH